MYHIPLKQKKRVLFKVSFSMQENEEYAKSVPAKVQAI
jgi:hypothetical protein